MNKKGINNFVKLLIKKSIAYVYFLRFIFFENIKIKQSDIVFFFPYYHTGGAERVHLNIIQALKAHKCCVIFTHLSATNNFYNEFKQHASIIELNDIRNKKNNFINNLLKNSIVAAINKSVTVKGVFGCNTNYFYEILPGINSSKKRVDLIHALAPRDDRKIMLVNSAKFLDSRIVINEKSKKDIISSYKTEKIDTQFADRILLIENGVEIMSNDFDVLKSKCFDQINIGFLGRWSEEKRPQIFLKVAIKIKKRFPNVSFFMAGTGMKSNLNQINDAGVVFLGEIKDQENLRMLYKKLNFIMITSVYEGFPMVIMESMPYGVIPICTNVGGIHEHIEDMKNGVLINKEYDEDIIEAFIEKLIYLIENKDITSELLNNAFYYSINNFKIEKFNKSYQDLFVSNL
ncbi:glycosyltransferase family 4 protein [Pseudotamlana carrageenivorans]|uniref:Uncharacterized protein n=1 Tax=Pseudotamlana carrageenivorans TaxID=2069432 RepID=A0A2I7SE07_9FLAO|nr:glycosyltransferase family 4 protein [Tamlana carrageenivorans]AUS04131.1 hypothetical protein C1A40_00935 [Tamlana carrageenivorans]